ncbi:MAG TPA: hypothetical protein VGP10_03880 [Marisediminicola sp.]|jgi:hypothetical protein|nr:hypothetical protein [Marisediminicola sp.]
MADKSDLPFSPVRILHESGVRSELAYTGAFVSIVLSLIAWSVSRKRSATTAPDSNRKAQADRWGIFIGHWAPTFFGLGVALRLYENEHK